MVVKDVGTLITLICVTVSVLLSVCDVSVRVAVETLVSVV